MEEVDCRDSSLNRECEREGRQERTVDRTPKLPKPREDAKRELPESMLSCLGAVASHLDDD
jgi:hypothetical protein